MFGLTEAAQAMGGRLVPPDAKTGSPVVRRVVIDSRRARAGDLFIAFPGEKTDGHLYVSEAFHKGAAACVVSRPPEQFPGRPLVCVEDTGAALLRLASWYRSARIKVPVVGITGSSGKSTTKEMTAKLLRAHFPVLAAPESFNNEMGVPLTLLSYQPDQKAVVLELAMRGKGQIRRLCEIARPSLGLVTCVGEAHAGLLGSVQAVADAKGELLTSLPADGLAFLNSEDSWTPYLKPKASCAVETYGFHPQDRVSAQNIRETWEGVRFTLHARRLGESAGDEVACHLPLLGRHNLLNFLGAASIALALGVPLSKISQAAGTISPLHGRLEKKQALRGVLVCDDSYNANPGSVSAAIAAVNALPAAGRRVLVLGDMLELGDLAPEAHARIGREASGKMDALFAVGNLSRCAVEEAQAKGLKGARHFPDAAALTAELKRFLKSGDVVLVKGSRKMALEKIVESVCRF